ncbi:MAG TPA: hypothetical protein VJN44_06510 [Roseateles sp.]|nr:hypothetical protein [Roseateles sp.]
MSERHTRGPRIGSCLAGLVLLAPLVIAATAGAQPAPASEAASALVRPAEGRQQEMRVLMRFRRPGGAWSEQSATLLLHRTPTPSETILRLRPEALDAAWFVELSAYQFEDGELRYEGRLLAGTGDDFLAPPQSLRPDGRPVHFEGRAPRGAGELRVELSLRPR